MTLTVTDIQLCKYIHVGYMQITKTANLVINATFSEANDDHEHSIFKSKLKY